MDNFLSIIIINYNGRHLLGKCLLSVLEQTHMNIEVIFIDNNSADGSCEFVNEKFPQITSVRNGKNLGYAAAANQGIGIAKGDFVMIMNPDVILDNDYVEKCLRKMGADKSIGVIGGKVLKYDFSADRKTNVIDTVGLFSFRNRRIIDEGQGMEDKGQYDHEREVFGISGACPIYRKEALEDVKVFGEYLDNDFFMYKEDIDLSWRLRLRGWKCFYLPSAMAWHGRGTGVLKRFTHIEVLKNRSKLSKFQKYHSYKNQRLMQLKNEMLRGFLHDFFPIIWKEILIGGYMIFREPFLIKAFFHTLYLLPRELCKRRCIMRNRKVEWREMEQWLSNKKNENPGH